MNLNTKPNLLSHMIAVALLAGSAQALAQQKEGAGVLEEVIVTAQKREESIMDVPISITALGAEELNVYSSAGQDIRFLRGRVPSLNIESSFGRLFPRFYIRGWGNTDFDINASQPVSLVYDDVVMENPILKGFPIFDTQRVEVLRGPRARCSAVTRRPAWSMYARWRLRRTRVVTPRCPCWTMNTTWKALLAVLSEMIFPPVCRSSTWIAMIG